MIHDPHLNPDDKPETLEEVQEKHFPDVPLEKLAKIMPNRPRRDGAKTVGQIMGEQLDREIMDQVPVLKDSGERRQFKTGAVRDRSAGKGRFDLIPTQMMFRLARHYEAGSIKYSDRNWEKGMEFSVYVDAAKRHLEKYVAGWNDEDHLAAAIWNLAALMFMEEKMPELDDLPERQREAVDMLKWVVRKPEDA